MAKGYTQTFGIDYQEILVLIVKVNLVKAVITCKSEVAALSIWSKKKAFLNGDLEEEAYMATPLGFIMPKCCRKGL